MAALRSFNRAILMIALLLTAGFPSLGQETTSQETMDPLLKEAIANAPTSEQWPDSDYAVLLDLETFTVGAQGLHVRELRIVRKVFNKHAKDIGYLFQRYDNRDVSVSLLKARTILRDGTTYEASPSDIKTARRKPDDPEKDWTDEIRVAMPAVESGCVLDVTWKIQVLRVPIPGHFEIDSWNFSDPEGPVSLSRLTLVAPAERQIHYQVYNDSALQPAVETSPDGKTRTYIWERRNLPALQPKEPLMPDFFDIGVWMDVTTVPDYQTIADWFGKLFQASMTVTDEVRKTAEKVAGSKRTAEEKTRALYEWTLKNIRYDLFETGKQDFGPDTAADIFKRKSGDCKDMSVLLATMLQAAGVPSFPVFIPHKGHRRPSKQLPIVGNFDHCIVQAMVDGKPVWLDATSEEDYGLIPLPLEGREALVIRQGVGTFETFPDLEHSQTIIREITYQENGERREKVEHILKNMAPARFRRIMSSRDVQLLWNPNADIWENTQIDGPAKVKSENGELRFQVKIKVKNDVVREGDRLKASLPLDADTEEITVPVKRRKWSLVTRDTLIETMQCSITAPKGYVIENTPESIDITLNHAHYSRKMEKSPDGRTLTVTMSTHIQAGAVSAAEIDPEKTKAFLKNLPPSKMELVFVREAGKR